jgi:hypothetical protein
MNKIMGGAVAGVVFVGGFLLWLGVVDLRFPWQVLPEFNQVSVAVGLPDEARIIGVEPIHLDCRARVYAEVPVHGTREHRLFGQVYRTDTIDMTALGDIDTCVEGASAQVHHLRDGTTEVVIPGESIVFVRPRVDAVATADSVRVTKGHVSRLTDVFPWVDTDAGLTPLAYAYAQSVIGSSECTETAFAVTEQVLVDAYTEQFVANGADPEDLRVRIEGRPDFPSAPAVDLGDLEMDVEHDAISCVAADQIGADQPQ